MLLLINGYNAFAQEVIKGLAVLVEYTGTPFQESVDSVSMLLNKPGFTGWGAMGSVRDYFLTQSSGKLDISCTVIKVLMTGTASYYHGGAGGDSYIADVAAKIRQTYPSGFQNLTLKPDGSIMHFVILNKAGGGAGAFDQQIGNTNIKNNGVDVPIVKGNVTKYGANQKPEHNTICHEMGHNLLDWTDYYNTAWSNLGNYCLMGSAGSDLGPMPINPAFRLKKGWIDNVINIGDITYTYTAASNSYNTIYKYTNPSNPKEYLLIHPQVYGGYYQQYMPNNNIADQGLAIYYVDEDGGMDLPGYETDILVKLVTADNIDEMHDEENQQDVRGDFDDLYDNIKNSFPNGTPFRWKDGGEFGLSITNISAPGSTISFTVNAAPTKIVATSDLNGKISPAGVIGIPSGQTKTFTFYPYPGYELNTAKIDGSQISVTGNQYTYTGATGTHKLEVTYKRKAVPDQLPSPWQHTDIGSPSISGVSGYSAGKFYLESNGWDIWGSHDHMRFVYQAVNGNVSIEGKLDYSNKPQDWSKVGLMIRESLQPDAAHSMLLYTPTNYIRVQYRSAAGQNTSDVEDLGKRNVYERYKWFKITRQGNVITSYCSRDKVTWKQLAQLTIPMGTQVYVGMAVSGAAGDYACRAIFDNVTVTPDNTPPSITVTSPAPNSSFTSPANISISASASDANGTISKVEFFNGTTLLATVFSAPYTYIWPNVLAGTYAITAKATDNQGAVTSQTVSNISVINSIEDIAGPNCGNNNTILLYELSASKRVNANNFNWWYNGSAQGITPVSGATYKANLNTGNNFGSGQVCVGVSYNGAPHYTNFCKSVTKCSGTREAESEWIETTSVTSVKFQNPFSNTTTITFSDANKPTMIQIYNSSGVLLKEAVANDYYEFGSDLRPGLYIVKLNTEGKAEILKLIKE